MLVKGDLGLKNARQQTGLVRALKAIRRERGLSGPDVARNMGVDEATVYRFESGETNFTMSTLRKYAKAVGAELEMSATLASDFKEAEQARSLKR